MVKDAKDRDYQSHQERELPIYVPEVLIFETPDEVDAYAASRVIRQITTHPASSLTVPTGNTPTGMYERLVAANSNGEVDFSQATFINLDEYYPISPDHPSSYTEYMKRNFTGRVKVGEWHIPNGAAPDPESEARRYADLLAQRQPIDLAVIGIGPGTTCHIGFNEKGSSIDSGVRYAPLASETQAVNAQLFDDPAEIPAGTLTQGIADILGARQILLLAKGPSKAWGINRTLKGLISSDAPASFLRHHPRVTFALDKESARYIR